MQVVWFLLFLVISNFLVMQIFRLSTYHAYFWRAFPLLVLYGALVGWLLFEFNLHAFFFWQLVLASVWLFVIGRKLSADTSQLLELGGDDANAVRFLAESAAQTQRYYAYSSFVYIVAFAITFTWLYNQ